MTTLTVRTGYDTMALSSNPSTEYGATKYLYLLTGARYAYIYLKNPAPRGAVVTSAILRLTARGASTGSRTLTGRRIAGPWKAASLNWNNRPAVISSPTATAAISTVTDGQIIDFDVTAHVQATVGSLSHFGWRIETTGASTHYIYGFDASLGHPLLIVTYSDAPSTPTDLNPNGGLVSVGAPVLSFSYGDINGDDLVAVQVQADPAANGTTPAFDSGSVGATVPQLDLASTAFTPLTDGASTQWRVRVQDSGGLWSNWSAWATWTRDVKATLTINNPAATPNNFVSEPTPPILWTFSSVGAGGLADTQTAYQVLVTPSTDRGRLLYDSKRKVGSASSLTLPAKGTNGARLLQDGKTYSLIVRTWDGKTRQATSGDPVYSEAIRDFTMQTSNTVTAPTLSATAQDGHLPAMLISFTRTTAPDSFVVIRDGLVIAANLLPGDLFLSGTTYQYRDWTADPGITHNYAARAVVNGVQSLNSNVVTDGYQSEGLWVVEPDSGKYFVLSGTGVDDWRYHESGGDYEPLNAPAPVRIRQTAGGMRGSFEGMLYDRDFRTCEAMEADLWDMWEAQPAEDLRLIADFENLPVHLAELSSTPHPESLPYMRRRTVSFRFYQDGELPFEGR
jgi:hypothetical protein